MVGESSSKRKPYENKEFISVPRVLRGKTIEGGRSNMESSNQNKNKDPQLPDKPEIPVSDLTEPPTEPTIPVQSS